MILSIEKMQRFSALAFKIATEHGWHEERLPDINYVGLAITEVSEAVNADRKDKYTKLCPYDLSKEEELDDVAFQAFYEKELKDTVESELADAVIRLLDYAYLKWGDQMDWIRRADKVHLPDAKASFIETFTFLVQQVIGPDMWQVVDAVQFIYEWADILEFDLDNHIEWKCRFNSLRPYKHGNKKY